MIQNDVIMNRIISISYPGVDHIGVDETSGFLKLVEAARIHGHIQLDISYLGCRFFSLVCASLPAINLLALLGTQVRPPSTRTEDKSARLPA